MKRAVILAHFDRDGLIDPYVAAAAVAYRRVADHLVLVSSSAATLPANLAGVVDRFIARDNVGYDFGSWRAGLHALGDPTAFGEILFVNDSVYGPLFDLAPTLSGKATAAADAWGMVLSSARADHVQSWFFAARETVIRSPEFARFWEAAGTELPKDEIIRRCEIGQSEVLRDAGFDVVGVYDDRSYPLATRADIQPHLAFTSPGRSWRLMRKTLPWRAPFDPSLLFYRRLWAAGVPYVKRRLFEVNPYGLDLGLVADDVRRLSPQWHELILNHSRRIAARH